jgi:hypothetical protein
MDIFLVVGAIAIGLWFVLDSLRAREQALQACQSACREMDVQLLDHTVALARLRLARDARGHIRLRRRYGFEFSTGTDRSRGQVDLLGLTVIGVEMQGPTGAIILSRTRYH